MLNSNNQLEISYVDINELVPAEYNPRKATDKEYQDTRESIKKFGFRDAILVNSNPTRKNIIIGGHLRVQIAKKMGIDKVPVIYHDLTEEEEKELNLRLNKNTGSWNWDKLIQEDIELLKRVGFEAKELDKLLGRDEPVMGEEEFSSEMLEMNNYVLFVFDNVVDWNYISEIIPIKTVKEDQGRIKGKGTGRVIDGKRLIQLLQK